MAKELAGATAPELVDCGGAVAVAEGDAADDDLALRDAEEAAD